MKSLSPNTLKLEEHLSLTYGVVLPHGTRLNDILDPTYWQHHSNRLRPSDKVTIRTEDNSFYAELFVLEVGHLAVKMKVLNAVALQNSEESEDAIRISDKTVNAVLEKAPEYLVKWISPAKKWGVKREGQKEWVRTEFESKEAAQTWIKGDIKAMAA